MGKVLARRSGDLAKVIDGNVMISEPSRVQRHDHAEPITST